MRDRWPGSTHRRGATERVALHTGGLVYIYLARIYAFASLSSYHLQTGAISRWCLMTRWQRNTSVLHARDMSFSSIISLYSSISLLFSRMDGWMDGDRLYFLQFERCSSISIGPILKGDKQRHLAWYFHTQDIRTLRCSKHHSRQAMIPSARPSWASPRPL